MVSYFQNLSSSNLILVKQWKRNKNLFNLSLLVVTRACKAQTVFEGPRMLLIIITEAIR